MNIQGIYTSKGLALTAKTSAGACLRVTRVVGGSGHTTDIPNAAALSEIRQTLAVGEARCAGNTAVLPVTLAAMELEDSYTLTELGIYAEDPDEGEILYCVYRLDEPVTIQAGSDTVLRFYLRQTVSEDGGAMVLCSPAGLITESDCAPARKMVLAADAPNRTVTVPMEKLADYLAHLPRLLTERLTIEVSGEWTGEIPIVGFYGCGTLSIQGVDTAVIHGGIKVYNCSCMVWLESLTIKATAETAAAGEYMLCCASAVAVWVTDCTLEGQKKLTGIRVTEGSQVSVISSSVTCCTYALKTSTSSVAALVYSIGAGYANNVTGVYAYNGGIAILGHQVPELLGGTSNVKDGGIIIRQNGTLL